jgi:hypothetical protein
MGRVLPDGRPKPAPTEPTEDQIRRETDDNPAFGHDVTYDLTSFQLRWRDMSGAAPNGRDVGQAGSSTLQR